MTTLVNRISSDLKLSPKYVQSVINKSSRLYKNYSIPKKGGGSRHISQASPELKTLQYWVRKNILNLLPVSKGAFAYQPGDSVKKHANHHASAVHIFHTDIKNFFPSIRSAHLSTYLLHNKGILEANNLWFDDILDVLPKICFLNDRLSIGTVSSPAICNIVMYDFDEKMIKFCAEHGYSYSRYADDIYISSGQYLPSTLAQHISDELSEYHMLLNPQKTWYKSKKDRRLVTGLVITDAGKISIGHSRKTDIKSRIYKRIIRGEGDPQSILGYLAFLKDIEPLAYNQLIIKYSTYCNGDVIAAIKAGSKDVKIDNLPVN